MTSILPSGRTPCCGWTVDGFDIRMCFVLSCQDGCYRDILAWRVRILLKYITTVAASHLRLKKYIRGACDYQGNQRSKQGFLKIGRKVFSMSGRCDICERKPMHGNNVSFSQRRTRRRFVLNVHRRRIEVNGVPRMVNICTRCLRTMTKLPKTR